MHIVVVGLNHKVAPVEIRERLAFTSDCLEEALQQFVSNDGVGKQGCGVEGVILSTCNRTEMYSLTKKVNSGHEAICRFMADFHRLPQGEFADCLYTHDDREAVAHLFSVASGLDSMIVGEPQILGQVRDAFQEAAAHDAVGGVMSALFRRAIHVGKRARTETGISQSAVSVSHAAVELAKKIFGDLGARQVLLVGAGEMGELTAKNLVDNGAKGIIVANRTYQRAVELAEQFGGRATGLAQVGQALWTADIVVSSTGATRFLITPEMVKEAMRMRRNRSLFLIDIAVPRDIDPAVQRIENVYLYDIDDLEAVVEANIRERQKEVGKVERLIREELADFMAWFRSLEVVPTITDLRRQAEEIRQMELDKALRRLGSLSEREENIVKALSVGIVNKILHQPTIQLKKHADGNNGYLYTEAVRELFGLSEGQG
jgi:glutamyl-tRNA reductase